MTWFSACTVYSSRVDLPVAAFDHLREISRAIQMPSQGRTRGQVFLALRRGLGAGREGGGVHAAGPCAACRVGAGSVGIAAQRHHAAATDWRIAATKSAGDRRARRLFTRREL